MFIVSSRVLKKLESYIVSLINAISDMVSFNDWEGGRLISEVQWWDI